MEVMEMAKFSSDLLNKLTEFLVCEIGSKALDGITYAMILKDQKTKRTKITIRDTQILKEKP